MYRTWNKLFSFRNILKFPCHGACVSSKHYSVEFNLCQTERRLYQSDSTIDGSMYTCALFDAGGVKVRSQ